MRYMTLAADYDGTLAHEGFVPREVIESLMSLKRSGRRAILVTGRTLPELKVDCPDLSVFDLVIVENGALLFEPKNHHEHVLGPAPSEALVHELQRRKVAPLGVGRVIVATWEPHRQAVIDSIASLGLELQLIFNKGAIMILPSGMNKATGLRAALERLGLSMHNAVGVGDAENDHAFLQSCECSAAVANALPSIKDEVDIVLRGDHGAGVMELIDSIIADDLEKVADRSRRRSILLGKRGDEDVVLDAYSVGTTLVVGGSGGGKSSIVLGLVERIVASGYQVCIIDPEGDYEPFGNVLGVGDAEHIPSLDELEQLLHKPGQSFLVNLLGLPLDDRPQFFGEFMGRVTGWRNRVGRPHWIILDEAHHLVPAESDFSIPDEVHGFIAVTVDANSLAKTMRSFASSIIAVGDERKRLLEAAIPDVRLNGSLAEHDSTDALLWRRAAGDVVPFKAIAPTVKRRRHRRKYATGDLQDEKSFYFTGPEQKLHLRAHNLITFVQMASGIDDESWLYHLRNRDYEKWFSQAIGDSELAELAHDARNNDAKQSREKILKSIESRYTAPQ